MTTWLAYQHINQQKVTLLNRPNAYISILKRLQYQAFKLFLLCVGFYWFYSIVTFAWKMPLFHSILINFSGTNSHLVSDEYCSQVQNLIRFRFSSVIGLNWPILSLFYQNLKLTTPCQVCKTNRCNVHSRSPVPGSGGGSMLTCETTEKDETIFKSISLGSSVKIAPVDTSDVVIIDNVVNSEPECDTRLWIKWILTIYNWCNVHDKEAQIWIFSKE